jgi:dUTP pyrophosphatase
MNEQQILDDFLDSIQVILKLSEEDLDNQELIEMLQNNLNNSVTKSTVNQIIENLERDNVSKEEAAKASDAFIDFITHQIDILENISDKKRNFIRTYILTPIVDVVKTATDKYHSYSIELPIKLEDGAMMPTYAHDSDAAADLYALEDTNLNAHTYGNKIRTGVSIQLPEGWLAMILPRSSIGARTPFRLSNSVGLIDSGYRGELGVLYDNTSNEDSFIRKGDRIAQLLVMPSYRFKGIQVDSLEDSDRGAGGFGSTGK